MADEQGSFTAPSATKFDGQHDQAAPQGTEQLRIGALFGRHQRPSVKAESADEGRVDCKLEKSGWGGRGEEGVKKGLTEGVERKKG